MTSFNAKLQKDAEKWVAFEISFEARTLSILRSLKDNTSTKKAYTAMKQLYAYRTDKNLPSGAMWAKRDFDSIEFQEVIACEDARCQKVKNTIAAELKHIKDADL